MRAGSATKKSSSAADVIILYTSLEKQGVNIWIDGGWGVDALLGRKTRPHEDIDIVIEQKDLGKLREFLERKGYTDQLRDDTSDWNFVLGDQEGHLVDVHVIVLDNHGNGMYGPEEKGIMYPVGSLTGKGDIAGHPVRCISPEWLVKFHTGYKLDAIDYQDVWALCKKFDLPIPEEYSDFQSG
ncbi:MAG: hypothetical protein WEA61_07410 [Anaerolineales bacterium]